jgi:hypothetical protein
MPGSPIEADGYARLSFAASSRACQVARVNRSRRAALTFLGVIRPSGDRMVQCLDERLDAEPAPLDLTVSLLQDLRVRPIVCPSVNGGHP